MVAVQGIGAPFRGLCAVSLAVFERAEDDDGLRRVIDLEVTANEPFIINYRDDASDTTMRFADWFDKELGIALAAVRRRLG